MMKYAIVIEKAKNNYSAYVPDLPGIAVAGTNIQQVTRRVEKAIALYIQDCKRDGDPIPKPTTRVKEVSTAA
jgi:predicted RNase H-like HicB family nuclease